MNYGKGTIASGGLHRCDAGGRTRVRANGHAAGDYRRRQRSERTAADDMSTSGATGTSQMSPASKMGSSSGTAMNGQSTHRSAMMGHSDHMMHGRTDTSQDAAVDQLNDQSYRAAQQGQAFSASNTGAGGMTAPGGSSRMNGMSSGPTSGTMGTDSAPSDTNGK